MAENKQNSLKTIDFFKVLSHEVREKIIFLVHENIEMSYTEILHMLELEEGNLNFHLRKMKGFLKLTEKKTYTLSEHGKIAYGMFSNVDTILKKESETEPEQVSDGRGINSLSMLIRRTIATLIDFSIFVSLGVFLYLLSSRGFQIDVHTFHIVIYLQLTLQFAYISFVLMETYKGQTIGKYVMKIRVVKKNGNKVTILESAIRNIGKVFFLPLDIILGLLFYRKKGYVKFLDYYTETVVEKVN